MICIIMTYMTARRSRRPTPQPGLPRPDPRRTTVQVEVKAEKRFRVPEMEGVVARWYARQRGVASQMEVWRKQATQLTDGLPDGADVLEVAPGPGYMAIEM